MRVKNREQTSNYLFKEGKKTALAQNVTSVFCIKMHLSQTEKVQRDENDFKKIYTYHKNVHRDL